MAIYKIQTKGFQKIEETSFSTSRVGERADLQRLLRTNHQGHQ